MWLARQAESPKSPGVCYSRQYARRARVFVDRCAHKCWTKHDEHSTRERPHRYVQASKLEHEAQKTMFDVYRRLARPRENNNNQKEGGWRGVGVGVGVTKKAEAARVRLDILSSYEQQSIRLVGGKPPTYTVGMGVRLKVRMGRCACHLW